MQKNSIPKSQWISSKLSSRKKSFAFTLFQHDQCTECIKTRSISDIDKRVGDKITKSFLAKLKATSCDEIGKRKKLNSFLLKKSFGFVVHHDTFCGSGLEHDPLNSRYLSTFFTSFCDNGNESLVLCGGQDAKKSIAQTKANMEYIERYALRCKVLSSPIVSKESPACNNILSLLDTDALSQKCIYDMRSYSIWGTNVLTNQKALIPLQAVYDSEVVLNKKKDDGFRVLPTSSGMAAHFDANEALKSALFELIERDAFMQWWLRPETGIVIDVPSVDKDIRRIKKCLSHYLCNNNIEVRLVQLSSPLNVSIVIAIATSRNNKKPPAILLGAGAGFNIKNAAKRALEELGIAVLNIVARFQKDSQWPSRSSDLSSFENIQTPQDHMYLYHHPGLLEYLTFLPDLLSQEPQRNTLHDLCTMDELKDEFKRKKMDVYAMDVTPKIFLEFGVIVVRCVIPQFYQLHFGFPLPTNMEKKSEHSVADTLPHPFP